MSYWLYVLSNNIYEEYAKSKKQYIGFLEKNDVKKGDVIIIFCKDRVIGGFKEIIKVNTICIQNNGKKPVYIFKDKNMNNFYCQISESNLIQTDISIPTLTDKLKCGDIGFKNQTSFRIKFLNKVNKLYSLEPHGNKIMTCLLEDNNQIINKDEKSESEISEKKPIKKSGKINKNKESDVDSNESESDNRNIVKKKIYQKIETDDESNDSDDSDNSDDSSDESESSEKDNNGNIPIMIVPCKEFKLPNKDREKYFGNHIKNCTLCYVTNNNLNKTFMTIIDSAKIEFSEVKDEKHSHFNPPLKAYDLGKKYEPFGAKGNKFIRVTYINNGDELYDKCILVSWIDK